jgi:hypothetical protein
MPQPTPARLALSFDVVGTLTDFVAVETRSGAAVARLKGLTNARYPARSMLRSWHELHASGMQGANVAFSVHSTTHVPNTLINCRGACTVLRATAGFRDLQDLGRQQTYETDDPFARLPEQPFPGPLRLDIDGCGQCLQTVSWTLVCRRDSHHRRDNLWTGSTGTRLPRSMHGADTEPERNLRTGTYVAPLVHPGPRHLVRIQHG